MNMMDCTLRHGIQHFEEFRLTHVIFVHEKVVDCVILRVIIRNLGPNLNKLLIGLPLGIRQSSLQVITKMHLIFFLLKFRSLLNVLFH